MIDCPPGTSGTHADGSRRQVYGIRFTETTLVGHWRAVDMVRSSGARFNTAINRWVITLPVDTEPLLARGRLGEALLSGAVVLEEIADPSPNAPSGVPVR